MKLNIELIDSRLKELEWSRYRLAKEIGITPNTLYSNLEKGSFRTVKTLSEILGLLETDLVIKG
uniref:Putative DNA binding, helix-turn-helix domain containing protein n=1 Tax=viral metagenome TaxID=1070528 RepID=A0A6M3JQ20_9ZZZZ